MKHLFFFAFLLFVIESSAQQTFSRADSLRGALLPERDCYDVQFYDFSLELSKNQESGKLDQLTGNVVFKVKNKRDYRTLQFDLFDRFTVDSIVTSQSKLPFRRDGNAVFVDFLQAQKMGEYSVFSVYYHGPALVAKNAPWDGGFSFSTDSANQTWIGVSCEGLGASSWWPNKDHLSDEPDSMVMRYTVPRGLMAVGNGRMLSRVIKGEKETFVWKVNNPINNYNVTLNVADYVLITDQYQANDGETLDLSYYVLRANEAQARIHFEQVKPMLACFEARMGKYPFYADGYALVETPYWGMEHQSAIAYGNRYRNNKWGFDFIIVHESGHEWYGNSMSVTDHADMWIHEGFCTYSETLFMECFKGVTEAKKYILSQKRNIRNKQPMVGPYDVNYLDGDNDNYYKGAWIIHTLRNSLNNDSLFNKLLLKFSADFYHKSITTNEAITWWSQQTNPKYHETLKFYVTRAELPKLEYQVRTTKNTTILTYRWQKGSENIYLPLHIPTSLKRYRIVPTGDWQELEINLLRGEALDISWEDYLIDAKELN